jgi:hypothetical protein
MLNKLQINISAPQGHSDQGKLISTTRPASLASGANLLSAKALAKSYVGATTRRETTSLMTQLLRRVVAPTNRHD